MGTKEIGLELTGILNMPIMEYASEINLLDAFCESYKNDERKAVINYVNRAAKEKTKLIEELERVRKMMVFEDEDCEFICGVDEVGRGPLAGPIAAGAVILPKGLIIPYLNDSKQVSKERREELSEIIKQYAVSYAVGIVSEKEIDEFGIQAANYKAMTMAIEKLNPLPELVLVDAVKLKDVPIRQKAIIKGDAKSVSIAAASIIAKVARDKIMEEYDLLYPGYGFASNAGYGSAKHIEKIKTDGPCEIHRRSFIKNFI